MIAEKFYNESIRIGQIIWLAANADQPCDALQEFFEEEDLPEIAKILGVPTALVERHLQDEDGDPIDEGIQSLMQALAARGRLGFLVEAETPVPVLFDKGGNATTYGFGYLVHEWFYTEAFDDAFIQRLIEWKKKYYAREKRRLAAKAKASGKGGAK